MEVKQFYDQDLAHASYALISNGQVAVVDPARDPKPYLDFAKQHNGKIVAIFETHPHADFVSSHLELQKKTGATIYVSKLLGADYPHQSFDHGDQVKIGDVYFRALNTPGHSPDSLSIVATDEKGKDKYVFTGDTLFIGDVGRPDLREKAGNITAKREELARMMYQSTRNILMKLEKDVVVFPAHGAGSLCGKNLSDDLSSTIGKELEQNYALQEMTEDEFVQTLLQDQPFIPKYFAFDVAVNKQGAVDFEEAVKAVPRLKPDAILDENIPVVDTRPLEVYNRAHIKRSIHIIEDGKFETWLGAIMDPEEKFYLVAEDEDSLESVIRRAAKIGYEKNIAGALITPAESGEKNEKIDVEKFKLNPENFTVVDVRNPSEVKNGKYFDHAINIPLNELRQRLNEVEKDKPVVVHCAGGYRSAAGSSILRSKLDVPVYDLGAEINQFDISKQAV